MAPLGYMQHLSLNFIMSFSPWIKAFIFEKIHFLVASSSFVENKFFIDLNAKEDLNHLKNISPLNNLFRHSEGKAVKKAEIPKSYSMMIIIYFFLWQFKKIKKRKKKFFLREFLFVENYNDIFLSSSLVSFILHVVYNFQQFFFCAMFKDKNNTKWK